MGLRYMSENALAAADIISADTAGLSPNADHPIGDSFLPSQGAHWKPPTAPFALDLTAGLSRSFAVVWGGNFTSASASWRDASGAIIGAALPFPSTGTALFETTAANAHRLRITATGDVRIYRIIRGTMQAVSCAIDPASTLPDYGLHPDFRDELVKSEANRFHGRFGRRSGEMAELQLTRIRKDDSIAQGIRQALLDGEAVISLELPHDTAPRPFYCWGDGILPPAELTSSLHWSMVLPIRYWSKP